MTAGEEQQIELVPGYQSTPYNEHWKVWIDYNQDGDFADAGEEVAALGPVLGRTSFSFVPQEGLSGTTRLRIAMRYGASPSLCTNLSYGEAEDYTIEWISGDNGNDETSGLRATSTGNTMEDQMSLQVYPNPTHGIAQLRVWSPTLSQAEILVLNQEGRMMQQKPIRLEKGHNEWIFDTGNLPPGLYQIMVVADQRIEHVRIIKK